MTDAPKDADREERDRYAERHARFASGMDEALDAVTCAELLREVCEYVCRKIEDQP